jgi:hypothetical protein
VPADPGEREREREWREREGVRGVVDVSGRKRSEGVFGRGRSERRAASHS